MLKYCVECGAPVHNNTLCEACQADKEADPVELKICPTRQYQFQGAWHEYEHPDDVIEYIVSDTMDRARPVQVSHNIDRLRHMTGSEKDIRVTVRVGDDTKVLPVTVKVRPSPERKKQHASKKAATVQIRGLQEDQFESLHRILSDLGETSTLINVSNMDGGVDLVFGDTSEARSVQQSVQRRLGGLTEETRSLHTVDSFTSKRVYRSTFLIRIPPYGENDVIRSEDGTYEVNRTGESLKLYDLDDSTHVNTGYESLMDAERLDRQKVSVAKVTDTVSVLHPETYQMVPSENPYAFDVVPGQTVTVVVSDSTVYIVND
mgnify:CR=1 FL=1